MDRELGQMLKILDKLGVPIKRHTVGYQFKDFPVLRELYPLHETTGISVIELGSERLIFCSSPLLWTDDDAQRPVEAGGQYLMTVHADGTYDLPTRTKRAGLESDPAVIAQVHAREMCSRYDVMIPLIGAQGWKLVRWNPDHSEDAPTYVDVGDPAHVWETQMEALTFWGQNEALMREKLGVDPNHDWVCEEQKTVPTLSM